MKYCSEKVWIAVSNWVKSNNESDSGELFDAVCKDSIYGKERNEKN